MRATRHAGIVSTLAAAAMAIAAVSAMFASRAHAQEPVSAHRNLTSGGPLKHGVYGRIQVAGTTPPAVVYGHPVVASRPGWPVSPRMQPVYLYVPSGQVRRWTQHCARWQACDEPVLFVRMEAGPGQWGDWRHLRDQVALQDRAP